MKKRKIIPVLLSAMLACSATGLLFACGNSDKDPDTYTVTYAKSAQGERGEVPADATKYAEGAEVTVKDANTLALDEHTFSGWTYNGKTYAAGEKFKMPNKDVTLTATWSPVPVSTKFTVSYELNEGTWVGNAPDSEVASGTKITLPAATAVEKGERGLLGWTDGIYVLDAGSEYTVSKNVTITALWSGLSTVVKTGDFNSATYEDDQTDEDKEYEYQGFTQSFDVTAGKSYTVKIKEVSNTATGNQYAPFLEMYETADAWDPLCSAEEGEAEYVIEEVPEGTTSLSAYFSWACWDEEISAVYSITVYESEAGVVTHTVVIGEDVYCTVLDGVKLDKLPDAPAEAPQTNAVFEGWSVRPEGDRPSVPVPFTLDTEITSDLVLVANWTTATYISDETDEQTTAVLGEKNADGKYIVKLGDDTMFADRGEYYKHTGWTVGGTQYAFGANLEVEPGESVIINPVWTLVEAIPSENQTPSAENKIVIGTQGSGEEGWTAFNGAAHTPAWVGKISKGEKVVLSGIQTSKGAGPYQGTVAHLLAGGYTLAVPGICISHANAGASEAGVLQVMRGVPVLVGGTDFNALAKELGADCDVTITWDWSVYSNIVDCTIKYEKGEKSVTVTYSYYLVQPSQAPARLSIGLDCDSSYAEITSLTRTTATPSENLVIGSPDHTMGYTFNSPLYTETLAKGGKVVFSGTMTSLAVANHQTLLAYCYATECVGNFRMDWWVNSENGSLAEGAGGGLSDHEGWAPIVKSDGPSWETFQGVIANCDIEITFDYSDTSKIVIYFQAVTDEGGVATMRYTMTAAEGGTLADSYTIGLGGENAYGVITSITRTSAAN